ncbi:hypothetical protein [Sphingobium sp. TomTYG45]
MSGLIAAEGHHPPARSAAQEGGETAAITKRCRAAEPTARPLRQGAGTGPGNYNEARRPCRLRLSQIDQPPNLLGL